MASAIRPCCCPGRLGPRRWRRYGRLHAAFRKRRAGRLGGSGGGGRHRTDRSARRSGRDHRRDRTLPGAAQRGDARRDRCRCAARAVDRGSAACAGASREMARLGRHAGPSRRVSPAGRLRPCGSDCAPRRSPRCIPGFTCWTGVAQRWDAWRGVGSSSRRRSPWPPPPLLRRSFPLPPALDRCRTRMLERLDALRRDPRQPASPCAHATLPRTTGRSPREATSAIPAVTEHPPPMSPYPDQANHDLLERIPLERRRRAGCRLPHRRPGRGLSAAQSARAAARHRKRSGHGGGGGAAARPGGRRGRRAGPDAVHAATARSTASCTATRSSTCAIRGG